MWTVAIQRYSLPRTTRLVRKHSSNEARTVARLFKESVVVILKSHETIQRDGYT